MNTLEERYEGNFFDALDLPEGEMLSVVIESVAPPNTEKDSAKKPIKNAILTFKGQHKRLILNTTNYKNLKAMYGKDPAGWLGKPVNIQRRYLDAAHGFGQVNTLCIRIIPEPGTPILKSAANFMGQAYPYDDPEAERARKQKAQEQKPLPAKAWDACTPDEKRDRTIAGIAATKQMNREQAMARLKQILASPKLKELDAAGTEAVAAAAADAEAHFTQQPTE